MPVRSFFSCLALGLCLGLPLQSTAQAPTGTPPIGASHIQELVTAWMESNRSEILSAWSAPARLDYRVTPLDSRLALAGCAEPPQVSPRDRGSNGRINLQVSCGGPARWTLYIPVDVAIHRPVVVATRPVPRGQPVSNADLGLREMDVARLAGEYFTALEQVVGMEARRPLTPDTVVLATSLDAPLMIRRGESVTVTLERDGLVVRSTGRAESDGRRGQRIPVRNPVSQRTVDAWVTAPGEVTIHNHRDA